MSAIPIVIQREALPGPDGVSARTIGNAVGLRRGPMVCGGANNLTTAAAQPSVPLPGTRRWRFVGVVALMIAIAGALAWWGHPPSWLQGLHRLLATWRHWLRVHLLASSVITALVGLGVYFMQRRDQQQRDAHARGEAESAALAAEQKESAEAEAASAQVLRENCWVDEARSWLPRVGDLLDSVLLGVHPAAGLEQLGGGAAEAALDLPKRIPVYVPRDVDAALDRALAAGGLVVVWGDSTAGKTRAAFEAVRRLPGDRSVLVPHERGSLRALLDAGLRLGDAVVWLNDLERYLGPGGLDVGLLRRVLSAGPRMVVLGTMRTSEYAQRSPEHERERSGAEQDLLRAERELLEQAVDIELTRRFSPPELQRAAERSYDPRIKDALDHAGVYGLAEYLAAGPGLWRRWRDGGSSSAPSAAQAGAAIVAAAIDCRRAGLGKAIPADILRDLYTGYVEPNMAHRVPSGAFDQGIEWACDLVHATSALLAPREGGYSVFDYLLDRVQTDPSFPAVPAAVWARLLAAGLALSDLRGVGITAVFSHHRDVAEQAFRQGIAAGDHSAEFNLGVLLSELERLEEAEDWWRRAAESGHHRAEYNLANLLRELGRVEEAEDWYRRAAESGHHRAEYNLGKLLRELGRLEEAEDWYRRAADAGDHSAENNLANLLRELGRVEEAEDWYRTAADAGDHSAENNLANLLRELGQVEEAEDWYRKAADGGHHGAENNLGVLLRELGRLEEAEDWYRRAIDGGHDGAKKNLRALLRQLGRVEEA